MALSKNFGIVTKCGMLLAILAIQNGFTPVTAAGNNTTTVAPTSGTTPSTPTTILTNTPDTSTPSSPTPDRRKIVKCYRAVYQTKPLFINGSEPQLLKQCTDDDERCVYLEATAQKPATALQSILKQLPNELKSQAATKKYIYHGCISKGLCHGTAFCDEIKKLNGGQLESCFMAKCCFEDYCNGGTPVSMCSKEKPCLNNGKCKTVVKSSYCECAEGYYGERCQHACTSSQCKSSGILVPSTARFLIIIVASLALATAGWI